MALVGLIAFGAQAQKAKVTTGVMAYNNSQNYGEAITKLEEALDKPELIKKGKDIAKAHWFLYKSYYAVATDTSQKELQAMYPDALNKAYENYKAAIEHPEGGYKRTADNEMALQFGGSDPLWSAFYNKGVTTFLDNSVEDKSVALEAFKMAGEIEPDHFLTNRMLGTTYLIANDTANGTKHLEKALEIYRRNYVNVDDPASVKETPAYEQDHGQMSYIYQQLSVLYQAEGDPEKALDILKEGRENLPEDPDISRMELVIYQKNPQLFDRAVAKFEQAIKDNPDDTNIKLAYASMLDQNNMGDKALELYQEVYDSDNENLTANYGIGAYYINQAASISEKKMKSNNDDEIEKYNEEIVKLLEKAYPYMVWLHNKQPEEREWLMQLVNITPILDKDDEMEEYAKKLGELSRKAEGN